MKKLFSSILVVALAISLVGCASQSSSELSTFKTYETQAREMQTFNYLVTSTAVDSNILTNCVDGLLEHDTKGKLVPALAEKWSANDDFTEWTFTLRDGLKWVDYEGNEVADVVAEDFVSALKYVLTDANGSNNTSMPMEFLVGAAAYNKASVDGADEATLESLWAEVGIKAVDDKTIVYTMDGSKPYFDTVTTYNAFYPAPAEFLAEKGADFGIKGDLGSILYNGCYRFTEFTDFSTKKLTKNASYWDKDADIFEEVTYVMVESQDRAYQMYLNGELDHAVLVQADVVTQNAAGNKELVETRSGQYIYTIYFNYEMAAGTSLSTTISQEDADNWNKAVQNLNFRETFLYGLDYTNVIKRINAINPDKLIAQTYTSKTLSSTTNGTDYTELVLKELGYTGDISEGAERLDDSKFATAKAAAMETLAAEGVTFPVKLYTTYKSGDQTSEETFQVVKSTYESELGTDFVEVIGIPYTSSATSEIRNKNLFSIYINGWGADFGDPINYLLQLTSLPGNYMNKNMSHMDYKEFNDMVAAANEIVDKDERLAAFAKCEAYAIENVLIVPLYNSGVEWQVTKVNDYSKSYAMYGIAYRKFKNWETQEEAYTADDYAKFAADAAK